MTSTSHTHAKGTGPRTGSASAGQVGAALDAEALRATAAEAALEARIAALESPPPPTGKYPPDTTLPPAGPVPAVPPLPALRVGTRIGNLIYTRITDAGIDHAYAKTQPLSCQGGHLWMAYGNRVLDGRTYLPIRTLQNRVDDGNWSRARDNVLLGVYGGSFAQVDVLTDVRTVVRAFPGHSVSLGGGEGALSDTGIAALQDTAGNICAYDTERDTAGPWLNVGPTPDGITMSHDGRWIIVVHEADGSAPGLGTWAYPLAGLVIGAGHLIMPATEHADAAVSVAGRQVWIPSPVGGVPMELYDIETGMRTPMLDAGSGFDGGHQSGRGEHGRSVSSTYDYSPTKPASDRLWEHRLDGSKTGRDYGFAYHRAPRTDYRRTPRAVALGDGRVLFASDWGTDSVYDFVVEAA